MTLCKRTHRFARYLHVLVTAAAGVSTLLGGCASSFDDQRSEAASAPSALRSLLLEGPELHPLLWTERPESVSDLPIGMVLPSNPHLSKDDGFIEATARGASQGRLDGVGMRAALYARYAGDGSSIGIYGLEAESAAEADEREKALREIWDYNARLDRAIVRRRDSTLVVVWIWTKDPVPEYWAVVKDIVDMRLSTPRE